MKLTKLFIPLALIIGLAVGAYFYSPRGWNRDFKNAFVNNLKDHCVKTWPDTDKKEASVIHKSCEDFSKCLISKFEAKKIFNNPDAAELTPNQSAIAHRAIVQFLDTAEGKASMDACQKVKKTKESNFKKF